MSASKTSSPETGDRYLASLREALLAFKNGDFSARLLVEGPELNREVAREFNELAEVVGSMSGRISFIAQEVGIEGRLGGQAAADNYSGAWQQLMESVNSMSRNLAIQFRDIAKVATAVTYGDLTQRVTVEAKGEVLELKNTKNLMADQLSAVTSELARVAREVGTEGKLGGQAEVPGIRGTWKDLMDNVNNMASNLTVQLRDVSKVATAIANGDLTQKITVDVRGEILQIKDVINKMVDLLNSFGSEVTRVAREVGTEGKLGGQAEVRGVSGTWKDLTDSVNQLAANLTNQVRAIREVSTAVTKGDLSRMITVEAKGEVAELKDNVNQMIENLKETTLKNQEQDWLKTNIARFSGLLQGQRNLETVSQLIMSELPPLVSAHYGVFYLMDKEANLPLLKLYASYAYKERKNLSNRIHIGEGLVGQCAFEKKPILMTHVPANYVQISSGLGEAPPLNILVLPILFEGGVKAVLELASFQPFSPVHQTFLEQLMDSLGVVLNVINANVRTDELLSELKRSNVELGTQARELEEKAKLLQAKNEEIEQASASLEEKAEQLSLVSKYKSEFLANMSHELRTPLNSMLILAKLLGDNKEQNLTPRQVEFAQTIQSSGTDLLSLINEILDLSKIESGRVVVEPSSVELTGIARDMEETFRPLAQEKGLELRIEVDPAAPAMILTDRQRLAQILRNLFSNALKFTERGSITFRIGFPAPGERFGSDILSRSERVIAFELADTGIGIPKEKQNLIWEAFQQVDASTSRKYGGTGLGLTISRELARLLGGEIHMRSEVDVGSTFTLFLPETYAGSSPSLEKSLLIEPTAAKKPSSVSFAPPATEARPPQQRGQTEPRPHAETNRASILLVVEDVQPQLQLLSSLIKEEGVDVVGVPTALEAIERLRKQRYDAMVLDLKLPGMSGFDLIEQLSAENLLGDLPIIVYTSKILSPEERTRLAGTATRILQKGIGSSDELVGEIRKILKPGYLMPTLHKPGESLPPAELKLLAGKKVLIIDDDMRNIFALVSALEAQHMTALHAENGPEGIRVLKEQPDVALVLMDIMMPGMDGYEATRLIRQDPRFQEVPVIALTAKAMRDDREKCLAAGANDYIAKPVDTEKLLELLARWLAKSPAAGR